MCLRLVHAANTHNAYAIGKQQRNGFHVRRVVFGHLMAKSEKREGEQMRRCKIMVERAE
jgi:hypothetical protein